MGEYDGVVGGVSSIVAQEFKPWWEGYDNTIDPTIIEGRELTTQEAYDLALNYQVELRDIYYDHADTGLSGIVPFEGRRATVAVFPDGKTKPLGIVTDGYGVTQNQVLKEFADAIKDERFEVYVKSAGTLFDFKQAWMLVKLGEDKHFDGTAETMQKYLLLATGHDGSLKLSGRATNTRVECMNTFDWAIKGTRSVVNLKHTKNVADRYEEAKHVLSEAYNHFSAMDVEIEQLLNTPYPKVRYQDSLVSTLVGDRPSEDSPRSLTLWEKKRDGLIASYERPDQRNLQGTAWGAVMAVNSFEQWGQTVRGQSRGEMQARKAVKGDFPLTAQAKQLVTASL